MKDSIYSDNEHIHVIGYTIFSGNEFILCKEEEDPYNIRWEKSVYVEPYEWGFDEEKIQREIVRVCIRNGMLICDLFVSSNVRIPQNNFCLKNVLDVSVETDYYVLHGDDGELPISPKQFRFMDGERVLSLLSHILTNHNET